MNLEIIQKRLAKVHDLLRAANDLELGIIEKKYLTHLGSKVFFLEKDIEDLNNNLTLVEIECIIYRLDYYADEIKEFISEISK